MFGYVIPNQAALDDEAKARYRTAYCASAAASVRSTACGAV